MRGLGWKTLLVMCVVALGLLIPNDLQAEWRAPNVSLLFGGRIYHEGQSNTFGPALRHTIDEYWSAGACTYTESRPDPSCDALRFGLTMHAAVGSAPDQCAWGDQVNHLMFGAREDGGADIGDDVQSMHSLAGAAYCDQSLTGWHYDPLDEALRVHRESIFSEAYDGSPSVPATTLAQWWHRANLVLSIIDAIPQTSDTDDGQRVLGSLQQACASFSGGGGSHPAVPTWVMIAPRHDADATIYGGMLAAAGGTARCCYDPNGCDIGVDPAIDMCAHIAGRTEAQLRQGIAQGAYDCSGSSKLTTTGALENQTLPNLECHLAGLKCNGAFSPDPPTSLFDIMACVQVRPRDIPADQFAVEYCYDADLNCHRLYEGNGLEYIDANKTLYVLRGTNDDGSSFCSGLADKSSTIEPKPCDEGATCNTGLPGRCGPGTIVCDGFEPRCVQQFDAMPEVCNGLDDDCDSNIDNLSTSWDHFSSYDPTDLDGHDADGVDRQAIHCYERDVCRCSNSTFEHQGDDFDAYVASWQPGSCLCGEGLAAYSSPDAPSPPDRSRRTMACAVSIDTVSNIMGIVSLWLLCMAFVIRGRQDRNKD